MGLLTPIILASAMAASASGLAALRWESRVLIIVAGNAGAASAERQEALLRGRERDLAERRMTVVLVQGENVRVVAGRDAAGLSAEELRRKIGSNEAPFTAALIGLDGGVKWAATEPISLDEINAVVDAMPMRRAGTDR